MQNRLFTQTGRIVLATAAAAALLAAAIARDAHAAAQTPMIPLPEPSPLRAQEAPAQGMGEEAGDGAGQETGEPQAPALTIPGAPDPAELARCEAELTAAGVSFRRLPPQPGEGECGIAAPYQIDAIAPGIRLVPETQLRCATALQLSNWVRISVQPAATALPGEKALTGLRHAATYVCRSRNSQAGARLSEHALGNAIDIAAFEFSDGSTIDIRPRDRDADFEEAFQKAVRFGACLHFTTVLGPASDPWHDDHLHLDIAERRGGYRLCRFPEIGGGGRAE